MQKGTTSFAQGVLSMPEICSPWSVWEKLPPTPAPRQSLICTPGDDREDVSGGSCGTTEASLFWQLDWGQCQHSAYDPCRRRGGTLFGYE